MRAVLLQNHGLVTSGNDMVQAIDAAVELELTCETVLRIATYELVTMPADAPTRLAQRWGSPWTEGKSAA